MNTIFLSDNQTGKLPPQVATIGFFDGVHRGHRFLIQGVRDEAERQHRESMVITFDKHPREVLQADYRPALLSTFDEKMALIGKTGVDNCAVIGFTPEVAALSAHDFMRDILLKRLNVRTLVIGYDNRFGHNRTEGFEDYVRYGLELGIGVMQSRAMTVNGTQVSSSVVRRCLEEGDIRQARLCLGRPYSVSGKVVTGFQEGRKIGFPTANIDVSGSGKLIPAHGVYAVRATIGDSPEPYAAMMNIGRRPTFDGHDTTLEAHIIGFSGDIYGQTLHIAFLQRLRDERRYPSPEALKTQLEADREAAIRIFETEP